MVCYLCNGSDFSARKGVVRDDPSLRIWECTACGLVALSSADHIGPGHYADSGMHGDEPPPIDTWLRDTETDDQRRFEMLRSAMVNRAVLDFGCGNAGFVRKAQSVAAVAEGVEPERRVRQFWGEGVKIHGSLGDARIQFDVITAFHVIEHIPDPRNALRDLASRLAQGGRLVVEVPSCDDALLGLYDSDGFQRFTYWSQHLFLFNPQTLRRLATQAGLRVISIQQFQRYPLSNHLYWLSRNRPGGHREWAFLDTPQLTAAYGSALAANGMCDTIVAHLEIQPGEADIK